MRTFIITFLATLAILVALLGYLERRAGAQPQPPQYSSFHRPKTLSPGDLCYNAYADGYRTCQRHDEEWVGTKTSYATTAEKRRLIDEMGSVHCQSFAGIWYDHCRWRAQDPVGNDCHHGKEDGEP